MLEEVHAFLNKAIKLDQGKAFVFAVDNSIKELIVSLNTHEQLGDDGIDALGVSLGEYAPFTVQKKQTEGQGIGAITDHITFYDTGDYWASFTVTVDRQAITISVDQSKFDELVNDLGFSPNHVGLTDENLNKLAAAMVLRYQAFVRKKLGI